jgi:hypothetical protein
MEKNEEMGIEKNGEVGRWNAEIGIIEIRS